MVTLYLTLFPAYYETENLTISAAQLPYYYSTCDTTFGAGTQSGNYHFMYHTTLGCDSVITLHLTVTDTTNIGIQENMESAIRCFPNPTQHHVTISGLSGHERITLYDMSGRVIRSFLNDKQTVQIEMETYADGIYFVAIESDKGKVVKRIVKN